jgi:sugar phosphate isomerase/epimerase
MLRLSVNELSTMRWSFEEDVIHYQQAGFSAIGIWYPKLAEYGEEKGCELLRENHFEISSITHFAGFTGSGGQSFRQSMFKALDVIQLASDINAKTVVIHAGSRNGHTRNHAMRLLKTAFRVLAEAAQAVNVQLALEPVHMGCGPDFFLNTVPQCLDVIAEIDNPNLGVVFDSYHLALDSDVLNWFDSISSYVRLVQLGDAKFAPMGKQNRCMLGQGRVPLMELLSLFNGSGYSGFYEIELQGAGVDHLDYQELLNQSQKTAKEWETALTIG